MVFLNIVDRSEISLSELTNEFTLGGMTRAFCFDKISGKPPEWKAITGVPQAILSNATKPNGSPQTDGTTV